MDVFTDSKTDALELPPQAVLAQVRAHAAAIEQHAKHVARIDGAWQTRFWETWVGGDTRADESFPMSIRMEENRLWPIASTIRAALYPRAARVVVMPDYAGKGDAKKAQAVLNEWMMRKHMQDLVLFSILQILIGGYCGFKVGFEPGTGRPVDRTQILVVPYWEVMLDRQITCIGQERFYGHKYFLPKVQVEQRYNLKDLRGMPKLEPSAMIGGPGGQVGPAGGIVNDNQMNARIGAGANPTADGEWVEVLEWYNLVDPVTTRRGNTYKGRMEVYVLGQAELSQKPLVVEAMPFASPDGKALAPIRPCIFAHRPFHPFQPISILDRVMPQIREINLFVTSLAEQARRSTARKGWIREGAFNDNAEQGLMNGADAYMAKVAQNYQGDPANAAGWYRSPEIDKAMLENLGRCDNAFQRILATAPNYQGQVTEATKYETQAANRQTEAELAMYATQLYNALADVNVLALRAIVGCMQDVSDSFGAYTDPGSSNAGDVAPDVQLSAVGAVRADAAVDAAVSDSAAQGPAKDTLGAVTPDAARVEAQVRAAPVPTAPAVDVQPERPATASVTVEEQPFTVLVDANAETVTVADLDAAFEVLFVESTRTPLREDARKQAQLQLQGDMAKLWQVVCAGGPQAVFARAQMVSLVESFELPKEWHPDALDAAVKREAEKKAAEAAPPNHDIATAGAKAGPGLAEPSQQLRAEPAVAPSPATPPEDLGAMLVEARQRIAAGDLDGGASLIRQAFRDDQDATAAFSQAARSPNPQAALLQLLDAVLNHGASVPTDEASGSTAPQVPQEPPTAEA